MTGFMGKDHVYVVAEVGSNWGGSLDAALALIDAAADAGADAVKFQAGHADHVYDPTQFPEEHASFKRWVEPTLAALPALAKRCEERGIDFGCSAFCYDALDAVDPYVRWHKVAGIEAHSGDFLNAVLARGKPVVATRSLGGSWNNMPCEDITWLHGVTAYPTDLSEVNLLAHPYEPWGLSDHTTHPTIAPCAAVALGASVIEKHIRPEAMILYNDGRRAVWGDPAYMFPHPSVMPPDWTHSLSPAAFRTMVTAIRLTEQALGSPQKRVRDAEVPYLKYRRGPRGLRGA